MSRKLTSAQRDDIITRYEAGERQYDIALALGITQATVSYWITKRGAGIGRSAAAVRRAERMTVEERQALTSPAHDAVRGASRSYDELLRRAQSRERLLTYATDEERLMAAWIADRGVTDITPQKAIGKYNVDIAAAPVAVELFGGGWHGHGDHLARLPERTGYIADAGWNQLIVWTRIDNRGQADHRLGPEVTDDLVTFVERSRRDPTFRRQYRVIWGDGQFIAAGSVDDDEVALVPTGVRRKRRRA